jgi:hypothetical protein
MVLTRGPLSPDAPERLRAVAGMVASLAGPAEAALACPPQCPAGRRGGWPGRRRSGVRRRAARPDSGVRSSCDRRPASTPGKANIRISQNTFDPQLNAPHVDCATCETTFIGDYFGNTVGAEPGGAVDYSTFVSTYDDAANPAHYQQQIVASMPVP